MLAGAGAAHHRTPRVSEATRYLSTWSLDHPATRPLRELEQPAVVARGGLTFAFDPFLIWERPCARSPLLLTRFALLLLLLSPYS